MTQLSKRITRQREKLGLGYAHLAAACGVSENAVRCWEAGGYRPRDDKIPALARVLKMRVAELVGA